MKIDVRLEGYRQEEDESFIECESPETFEQTQSQASRLQLP